ncbi:MAG: energy-coupling factor transporter transmembrane component T [Muricomes sp.]
MDAAGTVQEYKKTQVAFDPRTKLLLLLSMNLLILLKTSMGYECAVMAFCETLLLVSGQWKRGMKFLIVFLMMAAAQVWMAPYLSASAYMIVSFFSVCIRKFLPCLMTGIWMVSTSKVSEFVAAMRKLHLPQTVIIPFSVVFRFFPTVKEEWESIRAAMKMRGIGISFKSVILSPASTMEYILVPLLVSAVKISEELSAAALSRGLDNPSPHTSLCKIGFHIEDIAAVAAMAGLLGSLLFFHI